MHDPRPLTWLLIVQGLALLALVGWWMGLSREARLLRLGTVMTQEHVSTAPPQGVIDQVVWLYAHRASRLTGMLGILGLAGIIGVGEGIARRRRDVLGGFLLRWWTCGVVGMALLPGCLGGYLVAPWPLLAWAVASGLGGLVALIGYGLATGRPYIP